MQVSVVGQTIKVPGCTTAIYSNSVGIYSIDFEFSPEWDGWGKTAVFQAESGDAIEVPISGGSCVIPWEVLQTAGRLKIGVYGTHGEDVMPTAWSDTLIVRQGTPSGEHGIPPTPGIYELIIEALEGKVDKDQGDEHSGLYLRVGSDGFVYPADAAASVNGKTGDVTLTASDVGALPYDTVIPVPPVDSVNGKTGTVVLSASDVGALPDDTVIPTVPVDSVNGKTGVVVLDAADVGALPDSTVIPPAPVVMIGALPYDDGEAGYAPAPQAGEEERFLKGDGTWADAPVMTVNGKTGEVELSASDVGALPDDTVIPVPPVDSVNGQTGTVVLTASDVGALPDSTVIPTVPVDSVNGKTGTVVLTASDVGAIPVGGAPVTSVNTKTGAVVLTASDVGALPDSTVIPTVPVDSVNGKTGAVTLDASDVDALPDDTKYAGAATAGGPADKAVSLPSGQVDDTSTSTAYTAQVAGITELRDGVCCMLGNGVVTSAAGCTLNVNNLGAKPIYQTMAAASGVTTTFNINYTMLFVYNSSRVTGGCWDMFYGYNNNTTYTNASLGQGYATCSTAAATVAKTASLSSYSLTTGGIVAVKFSNAVPASATLNVNSKGAKSMYFRGAAITADVIQAGDVAVFIYSTNYHLIAIDRWGVDIASLMSSVSTLSGDVTALQTKTTPVSIAMTLDGSGNMSFTWDDGLADFFALYSAGQAVYPVLPAAYLYPDIPQLANEALIFEPSGINTSVENTAVTLSCIFNGNIYWARMSPTSLTTLTGVLHVISDGNGVNY